LRTKFSTINGRVQSHDAEAGVIPISKKKVQFITHFSILTSHIANSNSAIAGGDALTHINF
jgi:hypothetical protein